LSDFDKIQIVVEYEFLKHFRRKRLYVVLAIALLVEALMLILVPVLGKQGYPDSVLVMAGILSMGPGLAALGAVFFAGDAIAGEFEGKTGFLLFINPIKRHLLWIGKYLAGLFATILLLIFTYIIIVIALLIIYHQVPVETLQSFGLCVLYGAAVLSVTFLFSAISKGSMGATVMTLLFVWVICGIVEGVLAYTGHPYWFVLSAGGDAITLPYGSMKDMMAAFGSLGPMGSMMEYEPLTIGMASWGMLIYLLGGFVGALWVTRRRQLA
jgi:ABC-2 type transport system permease protein